MRPIIFTAICIIGVCLLGLLFIVSPKKPQDISSPPAIVESGLDVDTGILWGSPDVMVPDTDNYLSIVVHGEEIIQLLSDGTIIGMDGRIIGYLNDEEVELLEKFWE